MRQCMVMGMICVGMVVGGCGHEMKHPMAPVVDSTETSVPAPSAVPMNVQDRRVGPFPGGDWSSRVLWEARYALSRRADGSSAAPVYRDNTNTLVLQYYGDWDYVNSDPYARDKAVQEAYGQYGTFLGGAVGGHYCGGTCAYAVRLILYRSTYWTGYGWHLTTPGYPGSVYSWCDASHMTQQYGAAKPGWIISSPGVHLAILEARAWDFGGWGWWVIDANWVGGRGHEWIGKHFMTDAALKAGNYWAWLPSWATTN